MQLHLTPGRGHEFRECIACGKQFLIYKSRIRRAERVGRTEYCCSTSCANRIRATGPRPSACIPLFQRFQSHVVESGECLIWMSTRDKDGYGMIYADGKLRRATHVAYFLEYGV